MSRILSEQEADNLISKIFETYQDQKDFYFVLGHKEQAALLGELLNAYDLSQESVRIKISKTTIDILKEFWTYFDSFIEVLIRHIDKEPVNKAISAMTKSGIFCTSLMEALRKNNIKAPASATWKDQIRENIREKKFKETFMDTNLEKLYRNLEDLMKEI